jgi:aryl-alcohol dehydrogenase-like predicted oxidoreductase
MTFGAQVDEAAGIEIIRCALDCGINFIDTADIYNGGMSEIITGKAIKGRRSEVVLATKIRFNVTGKRNGEGLHRGHMIAGVDACLKRLDTDYADIMYLHAPDYETPIEETMEAATRLVKAGKVRYIGVSNYASWQLVDLIRVSEKANGIAPAVTQDCYNLITRSIDRELVPCIKTHGIGLVVYSPIASGLLAEKHLSGKPAAGSRMALNKQYNERFWKPTNLEAVQELNAIANDAGMNITELAMNWCNSLDYVDSILTGMSRLDQLKQNIDCLRAKPLDGDIMAKCDAVWAKIDDQSFKYNR